MIKKKMWEGKEGGCTAIYYLSPTKSCKFGRRVRIDGYIKEIKRVHMANLVIF